METLQLVLLVLAWACVHSSMAATSLNITAIGAQNGASTLECWEMEAPFSISTTPGINGSASVVLGEVANLSYIVTPPGLDGGFHNAPYNQWVFVVAFVHQVLLVTE